MSPYKGLADDKIVEKKANSGKNCREKANSGIQTNAHKITRKKVNQLSKASTHRQASRQASRQAGKQAHTNSSSMSTTRKLSFMKA
jgi:DNA-binding transcriptional regulator YhcF (GntR family)